MFIQKLACAAFFIILSFAGTSAQIYDAATSSPLSAEVNRERGLDMLDEIKTILKENYYDKNFRGINIEELFKAAREKIKTQETNSQIFRTIAQVLLEFNDSHTVFYPPDRANRVEYGFSMQMIGNECFVTALKKGSDAELKGLKVGDVIVGVGNIKPNRKNLWLINYLLYALDPQVILRLYVLDADKKKKEIQIKSAFKSIEERRREADKRRREKKENPYKCRAINAETIACKLYTFSVERKYIDKMMKEAEGYGKLILDLRGNGGGYVKTNEYLIGHFFERDVKVADFIQRDKTRESIGKTQRKKVFRGDLIVLIDSHSASASEIFARVVQLEKRGKIVGDVSAGAVRVSNNLTMVNWRGIAYSFYGIGITVADLLMSDGKRLENVGVIPDHPVGPTGKALFDRTDPILSFAAELLGAKLSFEEAGNFHFLTEPVEDEDKEEAEEGEQ